MTAEEFYVQDDFSAGDDLSGSESTLDDAGQAGNGSTENDASFTGMTDGNPSQSEDLSDGFSDGGTDELQEQDFGFGSMDPDSAEEERRLRLSWSRSVSCSP